MSSSEEGSKVQSRAQSKAETGVGVTNDKAGDVSNWGVYQRLLTYTARYWLAISVGLLGFGIYAATQAAFAELLKYIITSVEQQDLSARTLIPFTIIGIFLFRGAGSFLGNYGIAYASRNIIHSLRLEMFNKLVYLPHYFFSAQPPGHLVSKFTYDVEQVSVAGSDAIKIVFREGLTVIGLLIYLFYQQWILSLIFLATVPVIGLTVSYASGRFRMLSKRLQKSVGDVTHVVTESIQGQVEVKSFGGERYEKDRFMRASRYNLRQSMKLVVASAVNTPVIQLIVAFALAALVWLALGMMGSASAGEFAAYVAAASMLAKPIRQLTQVNVKIQRGVTAAASVFELIDQTPEQDLGTYTVGRVKGAVEYKQVVFAYQDEAVIKGVDLTVSAGETVALVGRSGGGKSTLVQLLARFYDIDSGEILIDGHPISDYKLADLRKNIAFVSQNFTLFNATLAENIAYGMEGVTAEAIQLAAQKAHALEFIEKLPEGFATQVGHDGMQLSGGQRQRIAIARAILKDAPILILDEATSALDTESERYIQLALEQVMQGKTTFVIAHRLSTVEKADRIYVVDEGQIVESGQHQELIASKGPYAQLQNLQWSDHETHAEGSSTE